MSSYLIKRLLIMIPTFLGVSVLIWLVMTLSPGEPDPAGGSAALDQGPPEDPAEAEQSRGSQRFRREFALDRPRFWNDWTNLRPADLRPELEVMLGGIAKHEPERVKQAKRRLEDWSHFAVPSLVTLLEETADQPRLQTLTLRYLLQSAYTLRTIYEAGHKPNEEERARDRHVTTENKLIRGEAFQWPAGAAQEVRRPVVETWKEWFEERKARWDYGTWDKLRIGLIETQFGTYWSNLLRLDFGKSNRTEERVLDMIVGRLKYSLTISVPGFLIAWILAVFLGVFSATRHGTFADQSIGVGLFMLYSIPVFVMGTVLQQLIAVDLGWLPQSQFESDNAKDLTTWAYIRDVLQHVTLPIICFTYGSLAYISRQARSGMLEVLKADFVRTARAKGLRESVVVWKHAVRNGMMPIVTLLGTALPILLAGSVIIEFIFNIDGFGLLMLTSIFSKDYNVVMGIQLIVAALTLVGLLLTDLIYAAMDPRISYK